ncbi:Imm52 family immunity protein [Parapedobacter tibetensis]|uniref:Imm52 family immunity protein n=1 Tax=Parapedobacter tibetensis TaxID=2972951 RepID=UPI00214DA86B|nr:Imm52 family immunity protein [Parapedobacter tibetensis]
MTEKFESISVFWKLEKKEVEGLSKSVCDFLLLLKSHNGALFGKWYKKGRSVKEALKHEIPLEESFFHKEIVRKWNRLFDDLGARISYWTGYVEEDKSGDISFNVGAYGDKSYNRNSCVINLPTDYDFYRNEQNRNSLIKLMIDHWKPDELLINGKTIENLNTY